MSTYFELSDLQMHNELLTAHATLLSILDAKGLDYQKLRPALVPQTNKVERAYLFDSTKCESGWYGGDIAERLVPLLDKDLTCSVLAGDLILDNQDLAFDLLQQHLHLHKTWDFRHSSSLYAVYLNNLTESRAARLHEGLITYEPYIGYVDTTCASKMKDWLSAVLGGTYLKNGIRWLCGHEDDVDNAEDRNMYAWPLEDNGYRVSSLQSTYFDLFLDYKIERAVYPGFETDTYFSLNAISKSPKPLSDFTVVVEEAKAIYLRTHKQGSLARAGIDGIPAPKLAELIASKLDQNYLYNLRLEENHGVMLFNIALEIRNPEHSTPTRLMAALEYRPEEKALRLVTFF